jgi:tetratricopeptide (TPR) repeat protein
MKVAVYTIALNELQFVESWYNSAKEADYLLIADTGSTDGTKEKALELGINVVDVIVKPWRFDMGRNASLAAVPKDIDYCISLDMDEVLLPGWRQHLEEAFKNGWTRPRYQYTWNWNEDGSPGLQYAGDKIHARFGYRWKHPVHEVLTNYGDVQETQGFVGLEIHHHADNTKPRSQYLPLLKFAVDEDPWDDRNTFYYARELYYYGRYSEAIPEFKRHLSLPRATWAPERAASMRFLGKMETARAEYWFKKAIQEAPGRREPHCDLANHYYTIGEWDKCLESAKAALEITEKPLEYLCEGPAWSWVPYDLAAIASYKLGLYTDALEYGKKAVEASPSDQRLLENVVWYSSPPSDQQPSS